MRKAENVTTEHIPKLLYRPPEAAEALGISERSLWGLTKARIIPCVRLGRSVRYDIDDLRKALAEMKGEGR